VPQGWWLLPTAWDFLVTLDFVDCHGPEALEGDGAAHDGSNICRFTGSENAPTQEADCQREQRQERDEWSALIHRISEAEPQVLDARDRLDRASRR
jgi:hypothetical protein